MGMYCCCGVKKRSEGWICECDWDGWFLCFPMDNSDGFPKNIPIKNHPDSDGIYEVRVFDDGDYHEEESEFSIIEKNWGQYTNEAISHWKIDYCDNWLGHRGVYAWKQKFQTPKAMTLKEKLLFLWPLWSLRKRYKLKKLMESRQFRNEMKRKYAEAYKICNQQWKQAEIDIQLFDGDL